MSRKSKNDEKCKTCTPEIYGTKHCFFARKIPNFCEKYTEICTQFWGLFSPQKTMFSSGFTRSRRVVKNTIFRTFWDSTCPAARTRETGTKPCFFPENLVGRSRRAPGDAPRAAGGRNFGSMQNLDPENYV